MTPAALRRWRWAHTGSSLVCTAILLVACITGGFMVWIHEIDAKFAGHPATPARPTNTAVTNLDAVFAHAVAIVPGERVTYADWGFDGEQLGVNLAPIGSERRSRQLVFDAHDGRLLEDTSRDNPNHPVRVFLRIINRLHISLFAGLPGEFFLAGMTALFVAATVSGAVIYAPYRRSVTFASVRGAASRGRTLDIHNLMGIATFGWVIVVAVTGIMNAFTVPLYAAWRQHMIPQFQQDSAATPRRDGVVIDAQRALDAAHAALPGSRMVRFVPPHGWQGSPDHYVVWVQGTSPVTQKIFRPVLVDAYSGAVTMRHAPPWYLAALQLSRPLHFGDYGGVLLKVLWTLFDIVMIWILIGGLKLWWRRVRDRSVTA